MPRPSQGLPGAARMLLAGLLIALLAGCSVQIRPGTRPESESQKQAVALAPKAQQRLDEADDTLVQLVCVRTQEKIKDPQRFADPLERLSAETVLADCPDKLARPFALALQDAAMIEPRDRFQGLLDPSDPNAPLQRRGERIKVAVWTDAESEQRYYADKQGRTPPTRPVVWVTLVPEIQAWCRTALDWPDRSLATQAANALRVNQRLGIPPGTIDSRFVELWVPVEALLRSCADPDTHKLACDLNPPASLNRPDLTDAAWFNWLVSTTNHSYRPAGAPWTRLGYTYDWGDGRAEPPYGATEFVLAPSTTYEVADRRSLLDYCRK
ncbi:hypothetical protein SAMN06265365_11126 [Tistlia consotensis]|uniref:Uncharacterized protein n=1 Tax=Tistlia consotensis USBA 355 TaxID=560819 RepID=A0A1Y6BXC4_9PROT|nr:hypothetical protein [Tistlia consotensis]SMF32281.1 hypothetical protein SAMN05428998_11127 [Tistlia consotensis USBA 355]SNR68318.1 hypothetical protein SAMN06265365_11126 [Tistlia consotensis]